MWNSHSHMVISPQLCLKVVKNFDNDMIFLGMQRQYCHVKFRQMFSLNTLKAPESDFGKVEKDVK